MNRIRIMLDNKKGVTLLASMFVLVSMSLLGVVAVNMSIRNARISKNYEDSRINLIWAEAGIELARNAIITSQNPDMLGYGCQVTDATSFNRFPQGAEPGQERVVYCIQLLNTEEVGSNEDQRGSGQDKSSVEVKRFYKIDAYVLRRDNLPFTDLYTNKVVLKQIQSLEQHSRSSI